MIVVDTSVWIDYFRGDETEETERLDELIGAEPILVGDLVLCEILQGVESEREAARVHNSLLRFDIVSMLDQHIAVKAAANYRRLRAKGITVRKTIDLIIGTFCIEHGHRLLHSDRDFAMIGTHLGLRTV